MIQVFNIVHGMYVSSCTINVTFSATLTLSLTTRGNSLVITALLCWRDKITNDDVLKRVNDERSLLNEIWQRKHRWIGHVLRHDSFLLGIFEGRILGKRTRGRRRMQMLHALTGNSDYVTLKQTAAERTMWRYSRGISRTSSTAED